MINIHSETLQLVTRSGLKLTKLSQHMLSVQSSVFGARRERLRSVRRQGDDMKMLFWDLNVRIFHSYYFCSCFIFVLFFRVFQCL